MKRCVWAFDDSPFVFIQRWNRVDWGPADHTGAYHKRPLSMGRLARVLSQLDWEGRVATRYIPGTRIMWEFVVSPEATG